MPRDPLKLFIKSTWTAVNLRAGNGKYAHLRNDKSRSYEHIMLRFTRDEYANWCEQRRGQILALARPSLDRLDKAGHYTLENIQVIELAANIAKDKLIAKDGRTRCYVCKEWKDLELFAKDNRRLSQRTTICKVCDSDRKRNRAETKHR